MRTLALRGLMQAGDGQDGGSERGSVAMLRACCCWRSVSASVSEPTRNGDVWGTRRSVSASVSEPTRNGDVWGTRHPAGVS